MIVNIARRRVIKVMALAGAGMLVAVRCATNFERRERSVGAGAAFGPSIYFTIDREGRVHVTLPRTELGQGVLTALPMLIAEELECGWDAIEVVHAKADKARFGTEQSTVASQSLHVGWLPYRQAGAVARQMLIAAAAQRWGVAATQCTARDGRVHHAASARSAGFGELVDDAARLEPPHDPVLKNRFSVIGKSMLRKDGAAKCDGSALFGIDVRHAGMVYACVRHAPRFGAEAVADNAQALSGETGVIAILRIPAREYRTQTRRFHLRGGVAVLAVDTWTAMKQMGRLQVRWSAPSTPALSNDGIRAALEFALEHSQLPLAKRGIAADSTGLHRARYAAPFLAHATMEPMNCSASVIDGRCSVEAPTQAQNSARSFAALVAELPEDAVSVATTYVGGGFGRRVDVDYVGEAVWLAKQIGRPVKSTWTREEDLTQDYFRPAALVELSAEVVEGRITQWRSRLAAGSSTAERMFASRAADDLDWTLIAGADETSYAPDAFESTHAIVELGIPTGYMRSIGNGYTCFANESFVDELAHRAGVDPVTFRLANIVGDPRLVHVLERVAQLSGWGTDAGHNRHRGVAIFRESRGDGAEAYNLRVAMVVEIELTAPETYRLVWVTCVGDFGRIVNPDLVRAQIEGGIIFGLSSAITGRVDFVDGAAQQTTYADYPILRMSQSPAIRIDLVDSEEHPAGVGEKAVPTVAPALANALFAASGRRLREMPLRLQPPSS